ncbi:PREDICTED: disease resistance protein RPP13-like isoform X5 [Ipomoea nil]|uniref:disease resistance protein RPP13-like isoform X5 n=1 Tax=Ipomoea nil TaxID=35883 RepID=UPI000900AB9C|nr:PREDICTED: disease resistance protein RPP13-like isoform X5 [Ipomoea nil]
MACVVVLSLMRTLELEFLQPLPRPILQQKELIPCNKDLVLSLHNKLGFLMELFDENRMDGVEAIKELETKLRDVASRIEDEIELQVVHLYEDEIQLEEEENRIFEGIFDIFDKIVYHTFQPLEEEGEEEEEEEEMPQGEKSTHHCQRLHQTSTHHCQRLHQILHPVRGKSHPCLKFRRILHRAVQHIDAITEELAKAKEEYQLFKHHLQAGTKQPASLHVLPIPTHQGITKPDSSHNASRSKEKMVGKQDEFEIIKEMLIQHPSKQLEIVSIKGMGGIGKTTLAKKIYEHPSITSYFDKRAWTVASQHHCKRQMLLDLLGSKDDADKSSDEDIALRLYQSFKCQRYLVVMDDVWSVEAWDALKTCFPNDEYGSRVLLTTRLAKVANHICTQNDFSHQMQLLEQSESWELFNEKACKSRGAEFETIGRLVVEKCKGLPLAIIVVAGLFSKLNALDEWKNTANALSSSSRTTLDDEECSRILSLSYNHLPHNLKACFLYLGVFPEDHEIKAVNLARLWLAEGLVKAFENESVDAVANRYIQDLMDRNLIILNEKSRCGRKVKSFRMHDLLHVFCVKEAQNEKLLHVVESENSCYFPQKGFRWVSIQYEDFNMSTIQHYTLKSYRSVFRFLMSGSFLDFRNSNLLRVLFCVSGCFWLKNIVNNVHLRFLSVGNDIELSRAQRFLKSRRRESVELLRSWNLQTLNSLYGRVSYRLDERGKYSKFPQLHFICCSEYFDGNPPHFVQELYGIRAADCSKEYITNIPCLKKVRIRGEGREIIASIANLAYLEQLEVLYISSCLGTHTPINNDIVLLKNLRELIIYGMGFQWEEINILSKLPRLEVLNLEPKSCLGKEWEIQEEVIFCHLIALVIYQRDLKHWKASSHNFPKLEHLYIRYCRELREIPIDFAEILTLKSIELRGCLPFAVKSAKKIQDEQCEYGNNDMVVIEEETLNVLESEEGLSEEEAEELEESEVDN